MNSLVNESPRTRKVPWRIALVVAGCLVVLWLIHPPLLSRGLRFALVRAASEAGLQLEIGTIQANLARPIVLEWVKVRATNSVESRTAADIARIEIALNWLWHAIFGDQRLFRALIAEDVRGVVDLRAGGLHWPKPVPDLSEAERPERAKRAMLWLPEYFEIRRGNLEFVAHNQSYYFEDISADFSEERLGAFRAAGAELHAGAFNQSLGSLECITAWKEGAAYLAGLDLWEGVRIESFVAQLARPGAVALGLEASVFGGSLRADVSFGSEKGLVAVDSAVWGSHVDVAPLAALFGLRGKAEGIVREARFTFRGLPSHALDGQASLRLAADGFRWNKRGWESLEAGASMIHRRLAVSDFELKQKENVLSGSGEFSLNEGLLGIAKAPFVLNASASIKDLGALAGLFGSPFDEMSGRMTVSGSINGEAGKLDGFVSLEASEMGFRKHPVDSGRVELTFSNAEAQVTRCEFWSGADFLRARGVVEISEPHNFSGDIEARAQDIARYRDLLPNINIPKNRAGSARIRWQGDGTASAHSGAFDVSLDNFVSGRTPSGLSGHFAGTYSPQNIYFSGFELEKAALRFSTRATLARSGIKLSNALLRTGDRELAEAEIYLPIDPFDLAAGKPPKEALHLDTALYSNIAFNEPLNLRDLLRLTGNDRPMDGTIKINLSAEGFLSALRFNGKIEGRGLTRKFQNGSSPLSQFDVTLQGVDGRASFTGELASTDLPPLILKAESAFGIYKGLDGKLHWINPDGGISASLKIPKIDAGILRPLFPSAQRLEGLVSGSLTLTGTVGKPVLDGHLTVNAGQVEFSSNAPLISNLNGTLSFSAARATVEGFRGELGGGPFEARGVASLEDFTNPHYEFFFYGSNVNLTRAAGLQLKANVDLYASGDDSGGLIKGSLRLVDSRFSRRLEVTPLLAAQPPEDMPLVPPRLESMIPAPFDIWKIDISITNQTPFLLSGSAASGEIIPELRLTGTLENPVPVGQIELKNVQAFLPFTTMTIPSGHLDFAESSPWMPQLNVRGSARALDYEVQAYAFGPLDKRQLILRSDPPLPQDSLIQLLTAGMAPGVYSGPNFGETPGLGSLALSRDLSRKFAPQGVGADSPMSAPQINPAPSPYPGGRATLRGRFELWRGLSLMNEIDGTGPSNGQATFSLRLR
ncbi:MAG TPA: translocation/assembly module TamB domain-containing protein [Terrimicrobiaceae bacterium]